jgi:outer membrane lipoprotein-sorting protein
MMRALAIAALTLLAALPASGAEKLDAARLNARFSRIASFTAEVEQTKEARFLARPLKSQVQLSFDSDRITWKTIKPIASTLLIDRDGMHVESASGAGAGQMNAANQDPRAAAFVRFIRNVFALDFAQLERDFVISFEGSTMKAVPRDESSLKSMMQTIEMTFSPELKLETVLVRTPDETTRLVFKTFEIKEKPAAPAHK